MGFHGQVRGDLLNVMSRWHSRRVIAYGNNAAWADGVGKCGPKTGSQNRFLLNLSGEILQDFSANVKAVRIFPPRAP